MQTAVAKFSKSGHWVQVSEVEILSTSGMLIDERRYVVFSRAPGKEIRQFNYEGIDAKRRAMDQYDFTKSLIDLNH